MNSKKIYTLTVLLLVAAGILCNLYWISGNKSIMGDDVPNHLLFSEEVYYSLTDILAGDASLFQKMRDVTNLVFSPVHHSAGRYYNTVYLITAPFYMIFGKSIFAARMSNMLYIFILLLSVYMISDQISSRRSGFTAVFICMFSPIIYEAGRQYGFDLPMTSVSSLSVLFLIKSLKNNSLKHFLLAGLTAAAGILIKPQILFVLIGPAAMSIVMLLKKHRDAATKMREFISVFFICSLFVILLYFWFKYTSVFNFFNLRRAYLIRDLYLAGYFKAYIYIFTGIPIFVLFVPCLYLFLRSRALGKYIILLWLTVPTAVFFLIYMKLFFSDRFLMPLLPAIAVIMAVGMDQIRNTSAKMLLKYTVVFFLFSQFCYLSFSSNREIRPDYSEEYFVHMYNISPSFFKSSSFGDVMNRDDKYAIGDLIDAIEKNSSAVSRVDILSVLLTPSDPRPFEMRYWMKSHKSSWNLVDFWCMPRTAYAMEYPEFIIFRLPDKYKYIDPGGSQYGWPRYLNFTKMLELSMDKLAMSKLNGSFLKRRLCNKLYSYKLQGDYDLAAVIPSKEGFVWSVHVRTGKIRENEN